MDRRGGGRQAECSTAGAALCALVASCVSSKAEHDLKTASVGRLAREAREAGNPQNYTPNDPLSRSKGKGIAVEALGCHTTFSVLFCAHAERCCGGASARLAASCSSPAQQEPVIHLIMSFVKLQESHPSVPASTPTMQFGYDPTCPSGAAVPANSNSSRQNLCQFIPGAPEHTAADIPLANHIFLGFKKVAFQDGGLRLKRSSQRPTWSQ